MMKANRIETYSTICVGTWQLGFLATVGIALLKLPIRSVFQKPVHFIGHSKNGQARVRVNTEALQICLRKRVSGFNKSIFDQGWAEFFRQLEYQ